MTNDTEKKIVMDWFAPMEFFGAEITNWDDINENEYAVAIRIEFCGEAEYFNIDEICNGTLDIKKIMLEFIEEIKMTPDKNSLITLVPINRSPNIIRYNSLTRNQLNQL